MKLFKSLSILILLCTYWSSCTRDKNEFNITNPILENVEVTFYIDSYSGGFITIIANREIVFQDSITCCHLAGPSAKFTTHLYRGDNIINIEWNSIKNHQTTYHDKIRITLGDAEEYYIVLGIIDKNKTFIVIQETPFMWV